jgi:hypothetical protein
MSDGFLYIALFVVLSLALALLVPFYFYLIGGITIVSTIIYAIATNGQNAVPFFNIWITWLSVGWISAIFKHVLRWLERRDVRRGSEALDHSIEGLSSELQRHFLNALDPFRDKYTVTEQEAVRRGFMEAHEVYPIEHVLASDLLTMLGVFRPESYSFPKAFGMLVYKISCDLSSNFREMYSFRDYESCLEVIARREDPNLHVELPSIINVFSLAHGAGIIEAFIALIQAGCFLDSRFAKYPITEGYLACFEEYLSSIRESTEKDSRRSDAMNKLDDVLSRQQKMSHQLQSALSEVGIASTFVQDLLVFIAEVGSDFGELRPIHSSLWADLCTLEMGSSEAAILMEETWGIASKSKAFTPPRVLTSAVAKDKELGTAFTHLLCEFFGLVATSISALADDGRVNASEAIEHYKRLLHDFCEGVSADTGNADRSISRDSQYALLGVGVGCSPDELKAAYLQKVKQWHPDQIQHMAPELRTYADQQLGLINAAYDTLKARASAPL